nr:hypothetical protein GCM10017611_76030 [Rhodococcus wratislaviensis]
MARNLFPRYTPLGPKGRGVTPEGGRCFTRPSNAPTAPRKSALFDIASIPAGDETNASALGSGESPTVCRGLLAQYRCASLAASRPPPIRPVVTMREGVERFGLAGPSRFTAA